jgi:hypothetical protein
LAKRKLGIIKNIKANREIPVTAAILDSKQSDWERGALLLASVSANSWQNLIG